MLGTTVPEPRSDGRVFVCSAGVSEPLGQLLRIYPLARHNIPHRWNTYEVALQRPDRGHDSRYESWQVAGDQTPGVHAAINDRFKTTERAVPREARLKLLERFEVSSIREASARRCSLAILRPKKGMDVEWEHKPDDPASPQLGLFGDQEVFPKDSARFDWIPRLRFDDSETTYRLMIRDWGCFELMRKNGAEYARDNLRGALHIADDPVLLVGNINNQRNAWLVISVLNGVVGQQSLFGLDMAPTWGTAGPIATGAEPTDGGSEEIGV